MPSRSDLAQCNKCGLNFLNEEGLGKHTKRVHEEKEQLRPSKYKCDRCSDEFLVKDDFKKHKLPEEFTCDLCIKTGEKVVLPTKCEYNFHIITHRIGKPKVCDNCGSEFKNNKTLRNHQEQDKTVSCRRCNKVFPGTCPLQKHIKEDHDTKNEPIPPLQRHQYNSNRSQSQSSKVIIESAPDKVKKDISQEDRSNQNGLIKSNKVKIEALENTEINKQAQPKKQKTKEDKLTVKINFNNKCKKENVEPLNDTIPQEFFLPPMGQCADESILGL